MDNTKGKILTLLKEHFNCHYLEFDGDGQHFDLKLVSDDFLHKSSLERHRLIYSALGKDLQGLHALSIQALTVNEYEKP